MGLGNNWEGIARRLAKTAFTRMVSSVSLHAVPLCKCMDYVHEDLATMHKESEKWEEEYKIQLTEHEQEVKLTNVVTQPLRLKLKGLNHEIVDEQRHACSIKASILKQQHRTSQLLRMVSASHNFRA